MHPPSVPSRVQSAILREQTRLEAAYSVFKASRTEQNSYDLPRKLAMAITTYVPLVLFLLVHVDGAALIQKRTTAEKPNILFLFPDQWRSDWDGAHDNWDGTK